MRKTSKQLERLKKPRRLMRRRDSLISNTPPKPKAPSFSTRRSGGRGK